MIADEATMASMMAASQKGDAGMYRALLAEVQLWLATWGALQEQVERIESAWREVLDRILAA